MLPPRFDRTLSLARPRLCPKRSVYGLAGLRSGRASESMDRQHEPECAMEAEVSRWNWLAEKVALYRETPRQPEGAPDILNRPRRIRLHQALKRSNHFSANGTVTFPFCLTNGGHPKS